MPIWGLGFNEPDSRHAESNYVAAWSPYIEAAIEAFGPDRCMFESNFPIDRASCDYVTLWNVFKLIAAPLTESEKNALFSGTAIRTYRLGSFS